MTTPNPPRATYSSLLKSLPNHEVFLFVATGSQQLSDSDLAVLAQIPIPVSHLDLKKKYSNIRPAVRRLLDLIPPDTLLEMSRLSQLRSRMAAVFTATKTAENLKRASRFYGCGSSHLVAFSDQRAHRQANPWQLVPYSCNSRLCPVCNQRNAEDRLLRYHSHFMQIRFCSWLNPANNRAKMLTLTVRNCPPGRLRKHVESLLRAFRQFRRRSKTWRSVDGYIWTLEVTFSRGWHPHLHILLDASYLPLKVLTQEWSDFCTRQGLVAIANAQELKGVRNALGHPGGALAIESAVWECVKYPTKPIDVARMSGDHMIELVDSLHNKRIHGTAGTLQVPAENHLPEYTVLGGLGKLLEDPESDLWSDPEALTCLLHSIPREKRLALVETYPKMAALAAAEGDHHG